MAKRSKLKKMCKSELQETIEKVFSCPEGEQFPIIPIDENNWEDGIAQEVEKISTTYRNTKVMCIKLSAICDDMAFYRNESGAVTLGGNCGVFGKLVIDKFSHQITESFYVQLKLKSAETNVEKFIGFYKKGAIGE